jgi:hypothetical protein
MRALTFLEFLAGRDGMAAEQLSVSSPRRRAFLRTRSRTKAGSARLGCIYGSVRKMWQAGARRREPPGLTRVRRERRQMLHEVVRDDAIVLLFVVVPHSVHPRPELLQDHSVADV